MDPWDILFERSLTKAVADLKAREEAAVSEGRAGSFDDYRYRCGRIAALAEVQKHIATIRDHALGKDPDQKET